MATVAGYLDRKYNVLIYGNKDDLCLKQNGRELARERDDKFFSMTTSVAIKLRSEMPKDEGYRYVRLGSPVNFTNGKREVSPEDASVLRLYAREVPESAAWKTPLEEGISFFDRTDKAGQYLGWCCINKALTLVREAKLDPLLPDNTESKPFDPAVTFGIVGPQKVTLEESQVMFVPALEALGFRGLPQNEGHCYTNAPPLHLWEQLGSKFVDQDQLVKAVVWRAREEDAINAPPPLLPVGESLSPVGVTNEGAGNPPAGAAVGPPSPIDWGSTACEDGSDQAEPPPWAKDNGPARGGPPSQLWHRPGRPAVRNADAGGRVLLGDSYVSDLEKYFGQPPPKVQKKFGPNYAEGGELGQAIWDEVSNSKRKRLLRLLPLGVNIQTAWKGWVAGLSDHWGVPSETPGFKDLCWGRLMTFNGVTLRNGVFNLRT